MPQPHFQAQRILHRMAAVCLMAIYGCTHEYQPSPHETTPPCSLVLEVCNQLDDDCDGHIDEGEEGSSLLWYPDLDADGYGDKSKACAAPGGGPGLISIGGDCDDTNASLNPGVAEVCSDGIDNDCDELMPECGIWGYMTSTEADAVYTVEYEDYDSVSMLEVSLASDLNGDGLADPALGMSAQSVAGQGGKGAGQVWIVYSPAFGALSTTELYDRISGELVDGYFGQILAGGFDFSHDGIDDLLVGAGEAGEESDGPRPGGVFLFQGPIGGQHYQSEASVQVLAETDSANLGVSLSVGDTDGDGAIAFAAGDPSYTLDSHYRGAVYVFEPPANGIYSTDDYSAFILGDRLYFGADLSFAGDLNGDGLNDLAIGSFVSTTSTCEEGIVYIYYGPIKGYYSTDSADVQILGDNIEGYVGWSVSTGDANGDGIDDILVGAPGGSLYCHSTAPVTQGFAYLFYGPLQGTYHTRDADAIIEGEDANDSLGLPVMLSADFNGDGNKEIVLGVNKHSNDVYQSSNGRIYIFYGPLEGYFLASDAPAIVDGVRQSDRIGTSLSSGDVNADGYDDLLTGTASAFEKPAQAYLFLGGPTPELQQQGSAGR